MAEIVPADGTRGPIRIPEWEDVLHVRPREQLTKPDRATWSAWLADTNQRAVPVAVLRDRVAARYAAGEPIGSLTPAQTDVLLRGRQIYQDMQRSEIPGWRQKMIRVLTALDNVEDQIATVEWVTRPITSLWAPTRAIAMAARRTSNVLDEMERAIAGPSLARGPTKSRAERHRRRSARAARGKVGVIQRAANWVRDAAPHLLEAGQALDTWTGAGISLGGIFGALEEAQDRLIISAWEGAKFTVAGAARALMPADSDLAEILRMQQDASAERVREAGAPLIEQMIGWTRSAGASLGFVGRLADVAISAAQVQRDNDTYTRGEHALALYHSATLLPLLGQMLSAIDDSRAIERIPQLEIPPTRVRDGYTRDLLDEAGATLGPAGDATGEWQDGRKSVANYSATAIDESTRARATWLPASIATDEEQLMHSLVEACAPGTSQILCGCEDGLHLTPDPATRAELLAYHLDALPPRDTSRETLAAWLADQVRAIERDPDIYSWRDWTDITSRYWSVAHLHVPGATPPYQWPQHPAANQPSNAAR